VPAPLTVSGTGSLPSISLSPEYISCTATRHDVKMSGPDYARPRARRAMARRAARLDDGKTRVLGYVAYM